MTKRRKADFKIFRSLFCLIFPAIAACLISLLSSSDAMCADDDEFLISLPTDGNNAKAKSSSKAQKPGPVRYENMLQGVFYDLRQTRSRQPNKDFPTLSSLSGFEGDNVAPMIRIVQEFVLGSWKKVYDANERVSFSALNAYYSPAPRVWTFCFYLGDTPSETASQVLGCPEDVETNCWICIYSGYVVAPFSGKFRFVGFGDDFLVVRFNQRIVFDYGRISATLGAALSTEKRASLTAPASEKSKQSSKNPIERIMPTINKGDSESFYSNNKLEIRSPDYMYANSGFGCGLANGSVVSVRQGEVIPIEILVADASGQFNYVLFAERLDSNGKPLTPDKPLQLFRTSDALPPSFTTSTDVAYDKNSPVWKVVDSRGRSIPSHIPPAADKNDLPDTSAGADSSSGTKKTDPAASASSSREKQASEQPKRDPNLRKTVTRSTRGNVTTETVTEYNGDTMIETVTKTEVNGDTTVQTTVMTETKNGKVVKKTTSTSTTVSDPSAKTDSAASNQPAQTKTGSSGAAGAALSSEKKTDPSAQKGKINPFGSPQRPREDGD